MFNTDTAMYLKPVFIMNFKNECGDNDTTDEENEAQLNDEYFQVSRFRFQIFCVNFCARLAARATAGRQFSVLSRRSFRSL